MKYLDCVYLICQKNSGMFIQHFSLDKSLLSKIWNIGEKRSMYQCYLNIRKRLCTVVFITNFQYLLRNLMLIEIRRKLDINSINFFNARLQRFFYKHQQYFSSSFVILPLNDKWRYFDKNFQAIVKNLSINCLSKNKGLDELYIKTSVIVWKVYVFRKLVSVMAAVVESGWSVLFCNC